MNAALAWMWKEWRTQWAMLTSYLILVLASIAMVCWLLPEQLWGDVRMGANALAWFVLAGCLGVVLFAAPMLVRGEFVPKDDQFCKRMPGALAPALVGKLMFVVCAAVAMPLLSLLVGEIVLTAMGRDWSTAFAADAEGQVWLRLPLAASAPLISLLLVPLVAAVGTWLPGGRMAVGATALMLLALGFAVVSLLAACPNLAKSLGWQEWIFYAGPAFVAVYAASWRGRRGGGAFRSFCCGLPALLAVLAVPAGWVTYQASRYHWPDPSALRVVRVQGVSADGRKLLVTGSEDADDNWLKAPFLVDCTTGEARQIGPIGGHAMRATVGSIRHDGMSVPARWFRIDSFDGTTRLCDLETGQVETVTARSEDMSLRLSPEQERAVAADVRASMSVRLPDGRRAWVEGCDVLVAGPDGTATKVVFRELGEDGALVPTTESVTSLVRYCGHGLSHQRVLFDVQRARVARIPDSVLGTGVGVAAWNVGAEWLVGRTGGQWIRFDIDTLLAEPRDELQNTHVLAVLDDRRLLCTSRRVNSQPQMLFAYDPARREAQPIEVPQRPWKPQNIHTAVGARDARGRVWLTEFGAPSGGFLAVDPATLRCELPPVEFGNVIAFIGDDVIVERRMQITRTNTITGTSSACWSAAPR